MGRSSPGLFIVEIPVPCRFAAVFALFCAALPAADPEVFQNSDGVAAAINQDGTLNAPQNPAPAGSIVSISATGIGLPPPGLIPPDGQVAASPQDFNCCIVQRLDAAGTDAVLYSGAAPGMVAGIVQINFRIDESANGSCGGTFAVATRDLSAASSPVRIFACAL